MSQFDPPVFVRFNDKIHDCDLKYVYDLAEKLNPGWEADRTEYNTKLKTNNKYLVVLRKYEG